MSVDDPDGRFAVSEDSKSDEPTGAGETLDQIAEGLRQLRAEAGSPSYAQLVVRIARQREADGVDPASARPGRTTVYDAFKDGRSRIDAALVGEIGWALTDDAEAAAEWRRRAAKASATADEPNGPPEAAPPELTPPEAGAPEPPAKPSAKTIAAVAALGLAVNLAGVSTTHIPFFDTFPLYLDMIGTAIVAMSLGPWWGAGVGAATNLVGVALLGPSSLAYGLVQVV
ncbi:MAG: hypothetical protein LBO20_10505, partial [Bifidobacteriaceae bacterium]|nr:hypothetical protein [Bifidobacteriaceae bacterium]